MSYHARLSAHLSSLLSTHLDKLATHDPAAEDPRKAMVTDMNALRERDAEHARAWMTEGYARYVGGAGGFELKVSPEVLGPGPQAGRKRRYTEEPGNGLLMRRRMGGVGVALRGSAVVSDEEREEQEEREVKRIRRGELSAEVE